MNLTLLPYEICYAEALHTFPVPKVLHLIYFMGGPPVLCVSV